MADHANKSGQPGPKQYTEETLKMALSSVRESGTSLRQASRDYGVPFVTLRRHYTGECTSSRRGPKPHLGKENEAQLVEATSEMKRLNHGISRGELKEIAANVADERGKPFQTETGLPSQHWYRGFMKRHNLSLRTPMNISVNRVRMEGEDIKKDFFKKLTNIIEELTPQGLTASQIYNVDESGLCCVTKSGKVIARKGAKVVRVQKGGERGENITVVACVNAPGTVILPPLIIFRGKSINEELTKDGLDQAMYAFSPKSFIDAEVFMLWLKKFSASIPPQRPVLLLLDGHASHINLSTLEFAKANGIYMLCFPPHTTHIYQPLDKGVFGPLKIEFSKEGQKLTRKNKKKALNRYDFNRVLKPAWHAAVTPANITAGFRRAGIWPLNPDAVILPSQENNMIHNLNAEPRRSISEQPSTPQVPASTEVKNDQVSTEKNEVEAIDNSSSLPVHNLEALNQPRFEGSAATKNPANSVLMNSPEAVIGIPTICDVSPVVAAISKFLAPAEETPKAKSRRISTTRLLTSDEFIEELKKKEAEKIQKDADREEAQRARKMKSKKTESVGLQTKKKRPMTKKKIVKRQTKIESESDPDDLGLSYNSDEDLRDDERCGTCQKSFQKEFNGEQWIQCTKPDCKTWYHMKCQNLASYDQNFRCDECIPLEEMSKS